MLFSSAFFSLSYCRRLELSPASLIVFSSAVGSPSFYRLSSPIASHRVPFPRAILDSRLTFASVRPDSLEFSHHRRIGSTSRSHFPLSDKRARESFAIRAIDSMHTAMRRGRADAIARAGTRTTLKANGKKSRGAARGEGTTQRKGKKIETRKEHRGVFSAISRSTREMRD